MKYEIGQTVYYIHDDKVDSGLVASRLKIEHNDDQLADMQLVGRATMLFMNKIKKAAHKSGEYYVTDNGIFFEDDVFATKDDLIGSL